MTFVAAKQFGQRILIAADTMISHPDKTRDDVIPGALKIIILDPELTIAFAGRSVQALDAIKAGKAMLDRGAEIAAIERLLVETTGKYDGEIEFLIVSHRGGATLKRIWDGQISLPLPESCIGQRDLLARFSGAMADAPRMIVPMWFEAESPFSTGFAALFDGLHATEGVGGFGISATCAPSGHGYSIHGGVACWDVIRGGEPVSEQQLADRRSGMTEWGYVSVTSALRGVAVVGVMVVNSGVGYIYAPFLSDDPIAWRFERPTSQENEIPILEAFQRAVSEHVVATGGGIEPIVFAERTDPPTEAEMRLAQEHAARAPMPTTLSLQEGAIHVQCGTAAFSRRARIDFSALEANASYVLTETIDRINADVLAAHQRAIESEAAWRAANSAASE